MPLPSASAPGQKLEPVLAAWGFTIVGAKVLPHLMPGSREDAETVNTFFPGHAPTHRGNPLLVVSNRAAGIIKAIETCFSRSARQPCLAHLAHSRPTTLPASVRRPGTGTPSTIASVIMI